MFWVNKPLHFLIAHSMADNFYYWVFKYTMELDGEDSYHCYSCYCYFRKMMHVYNWGHISRGISGIRRYRGNRFLRCLIFLTSQWVCCLFILFFHYSESFRGYAIKNSVSNNGWLQMIVSLPEGQEDNSYVCLFLL